MTCIHPELRDGRCLTCGHELVGDWLLDAAELLAEGDPGPTPWLVDGLIVEQALTAVVGRWKTTKSYGLLDVCISIATGAPAFGTFAIPNPGAVVFVNEESGRAALWRRLDVLSRGRAIRPELLRDRLFVAPNARVKLDDPAWQERLLDFGSHVRPRLFAFDPLVRMKAPARDESAQTDMAPVIEFLRELRDETSAAVSFVQHTGHQGEHMRGSSDLESVWETRLAWKRDGQASEVTIESEHREAESSEPFMYRIAWDGLTRSLRFEAVEDELLVAVRTYLAAHPEASANEVDDAVEGNRQRILEVVRQLRDEGGSDSPEPPGTTRPEPKTEVVPDPDPYKGSGNHPVGFDSEVVPSGQNHPANGRSPIIGDDEYLDRLFAALERSVITESEWKHGERAHRFVVARRKSAT